jgi:hypothetical protein
MASHPECSRPLPTCLWLTGNDVAVEGSAAVEKPEGPAAVEGPSAVEGPAIAVKA